MFKRNHHRRTKAGLIAATAIIAAFLLVPTAQAFAADHLKVNVTGTGSGEVVSTAAGWGESGAGTPPIACSYNGSSASGVCENAPGETEAGEEFYGVRLEAKPAAGSRFTGWTVQKGEEVLGGAQCPPAGHPTQCVIVSKTPLEEMEATATFTVIPFNLILFVNGPSGSGTVTSAPTGINCSAGQECSAAFIGAVTLTAHPSTGYVLAGWIGCKQTSATTCLAAATSDNEQREATAIFLKEGTQGAQGTQGPQGTQGAQGTPGVAGEAGKDGAAGPQGPKGDTGAQGAEGKQGPAGKVTVSCKVKGSKKVVCTVKQPKTSQSRNLSWKLRRGGKTVAKGDTHGGSPHFRIGALDSGRYRLHIQGQKGSSLILVH